MSSDGPVLQHVLAGQHENHVTACMQVTEVGGTGGDTGVLTVGEDKVLLVWLLRDNGEYYPSARKDLPSVGRSLSFDQDANRIYVGMDNGQIIVRPHPPSSTVLVSRSIARVLSFSCSCSLAVYLFTLMDSAALVLLCERTGEERRRHTKQPKTLFLLTLPEILSSSSCSSSSSCCLMHQVFQCSV